MLTEKETCDDAETILPSLPRTVVGPLCFVVAELEFFPSYSRLGPTPRSKLLGIVAALLCFLLPHKHHKDTEEIDCGSENALFVNDA